jgi:hypothetical protein
VSPAIVVVILSNRANNNSRGENFSTKKEAKSDCKPAFFSELNPRHRASFTSKDTADLYTDACTLTSKQVVEIGIATKLSSHCTHRARRLASKQFEIVSEILPVPGGARFGLFARHS